MNKPLVTPKFYMESIPLHVNTPLKPSKLESRAIILSKNYFENCFNDSTDWTMYLKSCAVHVQSLSIAMQIHSDTFTDNHKYLAHQLAVLYVIYYLYSNLSIKTLPCLFIKHK